MKIIYGKKLQALLLEEKQKQGKDKDNPQTTKRISKKQSK